MMPMDGHLRRIEREAGLPGLAQALGGLAPTDLQSLLLHVYRDQAARRDPRTLLAQYQRDASVAPGRPTHALEALALEAAENFEPVALAPVSPLGLNGVLGRIDQNNVASTIRGTEVLADPTAALALEAAVRRREHPEQTGAALRRLPRSAPAAVSRRAWLHAALRAVRAGHGRPRAAVIRLRDRGAARARRRPPRAAWRLRGHRPRGAAHRRPAARPRSGSGRHRGSGPDARPRLLRGRAARDRRDRSRGPGGGPLGRWADGLDAAAAVQPQGTPVHER